jgi:hypothetical protein
MQLLEYKKSLRNLNFSGFYLKVVAGTGLEPVTFGL